MAEKNQHTDRQDAVAMLQAAMPEGAQAGEFHRMLTLSVLLPDDEALRSRIMHNLTYGSDVGGMKVVDIEQGHAALELRSAKEYIAHPEHFSQACKVLAMNHNATLLQVAGQKDHPQAKPPAAPMLTPWRDMGSLLLGYLMVAAALVALGLMFIHF